MTQPYYYADILEPVSLRFSFKTLADESSKD